MEVLTSIGHRMKIGDRRVFFRKLFKCACFTLGLALSVGAPIFSTAYAQSTEAEYKIKAAYLYNFVQYMDWPPDAFGNDSSPLIIGVLGVDPFGEVLDQTIAGESVRGRMLEVRRFRSINEVSDCHMLFISDSEKEHLTRVLEKLRGRSIFTVSDIEDFALRGGMLRFMKKENKIRFHINLPEARAVRLSISAKLLQLAEMVSTDKSLR